MAKHIHIHFTRDAKKPIDTLKKDSKGRSLSPLPSKLGADTRKALGGISADVAKAYGSRRKVSVRGLSSAQSVVLPKHVQRYLDDPKSTPLDAERNAPFGGLVGVAKHRGKLVLLDGNHRAAAAWLRGDKELDAHVVDLDRAMAEAAALKKRPEYSNHGDHLLMHKAAAKRLAGGTRDAKKPTGVNAQVFHGSSQKFDSFPKERPGGSWTIKGGSAQFLGPFVTESRSVAASYPYNRKEGEEHFVYSGQLGMKNPKKYRSLAHLNSDIDKRTGGVQGEDWKLHRRGARYSAMAAEFKKQLTDEGFDGVSFHEGPSYDPGKNKAATHVPFDHGKQLTGLKREAHDPKKFTDNAGDMFPVTPRARTKKILKEGLTTGHNRQWGNMTGSKLGSTGKVYLFDDFDKAVGWGAKMEYASKKPIDILHVGHKPKDLAPDDNVEMQLRGGGSWTTGKDIHPRHIKKVTQLTPDLVRSYVAKLNEH